MHRIRNAALAAVAGLASIGIGGAALVATAAPSAALPACTDNWQGPTTGTTAWNASSANWSSGFPTSGSVVCITAAGTYTVDLTGSTSVGSFQVGGTSGTQTLLVDGSSTNVQISVASSSTSAVDANGVLSLKSTASGYAEVSGGASTNVTVASGGALTSTGTGAGVQPVYLETGITNQSGGTVTIGSANTLQDTGTLTSDAGTFTVASGGNLTLEGGSSFTHSAGTLTVTGSLTETSGTFTQSGGTLAGSAVRLSGTTLADSSGTGAFDVYGSSTLTGTLPSGQTVTVDGSTTNVQLTTSGVTVDGTLALAAAPSGYAEIVGGSGNTTTVASGGSLTTSGTAAGTQPAYIEVNVAIQSGGSATIGAANSRQDTGTLTSDAGTFTVASGGNLTLEGGSSFTHSAGTLTVTGSLTETSGTFTQSGGTLTGNAVRLSGTTLADSSGTGAFDVYGSSTLTGTLPSGQTVTVDGSTANVQLTTSGATVDGTLALAAAPSGYADIVGGSGNTTTVASGGSLTTSGTAAGTQPAYIEVNVAIQSGGSATIGAANSRQDTGTLTSDAGTFTVASGGNLTLEGGSSFTHSAGTLTVTGSLTETSGTFTQSGGTLTGNAVRLSNTTLADSSGTGAFDVYGSSTLTGTLPSGQTVTVDGSTANVQLTTSGATVDGTLALAATPSGYADIVGGSGNTTTVASGGSLTTSGTAAGTQPAYIEVNVAIQSGGSATIGAADTRQDNGTVTTDGGSFTVANGGGMTLSGGSTLIGAGTFGVTVNGTGGGISGSGVDPSNGSTLSVATVGTATAGTTFTPITGPVGAKFSAVGGGTPGYDVSYPANAVAVTAETTTFGLSATAFGPGLGTPTGAVAVGALSNVKGLSGTYTATVDYGDGSGPQAATVTVKGAKGTVTGPTHTYTTAGTYPVTISVSNSVTGTQVVGEHVTVATLAITSLSKTTVRAGKKLSTKVSGTGFDASAGSPSAWSTNNPGVTVISAKVGKRNAKHPNPMVKLKLTVAAGATTGPVTLTLTQDTGSASLANAFTITAG